MDKKIITKFTLEKLAYLDLCTYFKQAVFAFPQEECGKTMPDLFSTQDNLEISIYLSWDNLMEVDVILYFIFSNYNEVT